MVTPLCAIRVPSQQRREDGDAAGVVGVAVPFAVTKQAHLHVKAAGCYIMQ